MDVWRWVQCTGKLYSPAGILYAAGYSGAWDGVNAGGPTDHRNRSQDQALYKLGPIPCGHYGIGDAFDDPGGKGPVVMRLIPDAMNEMFGRADFEIHGDLEPPRSGQASEGCIVLPRTIRDAIAASPVRNLVVV